MRSKEERLEVYKAMLIIAEDPGIYYSGLCNLLDHAHAILKFSKGRIKPLNKILCKNYQT